MAAFSRASIDSARSLRPAWSATNAYAIWWPPRGVCRSVAAMACASVVHAPRTTPRAVPSVRRAGRPRWSHAGRRGPKPWRSRATLAPSAFKSDAPSVSCSPKPTLMGTVILDSRSSAPYWVPRRRPGACPRPSRSLRTCLVCAPDRRRPRTGTRVAARTRPAHHRPQPRGRVLRSPRDGVAPTERQPCSTPSRAPAPTLPRPCVRRRLPGPT